MTTFNRIKGALVGLACGDALGATLEFTIREKDHVDVTDLIGGGAYNWLPGETTDDTDMTICVAKGILENPTDPINSIGKYFMKWWHSNPKDIGITCANTFSVYETLNTKHDDKWRISAYSSHIMSDKKSAGNGTLMRCLPIALYYTDLQQIEKLSIAQSKMTHYDKLASTTCKVYNGMIYDCLRGMKDKKQIIINSLPRYKFSILNTPYDYLLPSGYVVDTFNCVLWCFMNTESFEECVIKAANLCGDADTIAAIAGGLAGAYYGYNAIPERWADKLIKEDELLHLAEQINKRRI